MTNDTNFNAKASSTPSIMEPIDETPSLTLTASFFVLFFSITKSAEEISMLKKKKKMKYHRKKLSSSGVSTNDGD